MNATQNKLADALRACVARDGDYLALADAALAEHDAQAADPLRALILGDALADYAEREYKAARDARAGKLLSDCNPETRERYARGCEMRRALALQMADEMEAQA